MTQRLSWLVLTLALGVTALGYSAARTSARHTALAALQLQVEQLASTVQMRLELSAAVLRSSAGLLLVNGIGSRQSWTDYQLMLHRQGLPEEVKQVGYAHRITPMRTAVTGASADADATSAMQSVPKDDLKATAVMYSAPELAQDVHRPGFDLQSDSTLVSALVRATDTGSVTMSGLINGSASTTSRGNGQRMLLLPVFPDGITPSDKGQRRHLLIGFVFAVLEVEQSILASAAPPGLALELVDGNRGHEPVRADDKIAAGTSYAELNAPLNLYGRGWTLRAHALQPIATSATPEWIAAGGILISILIALLTPGALQRWQQHAARFKRASRDNRRLQSHVAALIELNAQAVLMIDRRHHILACNAAAGKLFQVDAVQVIGTALARFLPHGLKAAQRRDTCQLRGTRIKVHRIENRERNLARRSNGERFGFQATIFKTIRWNMHCYIIVLAEIAAVKPRQLALNEGEAQDNQRNTGSGNDHGYANYQKRIAQEMHDDFGQNLAVIKMDLQSLQSQLAAIDPNLPTKLALINQLVDAMMVSLRRILTESPPAAIVEHGLFPAISQLAEYCRLRHQITVQLDFPDHVPGVSQQVAASLYRIVQEALNNIGKHARATKVHICIRQVAHRLMLAISDDGIGVAAEQLRKTGSFGLQGMRERVASLNGTFRIQTGINGEVGTAIHIALPIFTQHMPSPAGA